MGGRTIDAFNGQSGQVANIILTGGTNFPYILTGSGNPKDAGVGSGYPRGSLYLNTSLKSGSGLYVKVGTTNTGTGWTGITRT